MNCKDIEYKNYRIYKNKLIDPKDGILCLNSINSECKNNISLKECMNFCNDNENCDYGQYIYRKNDGYTLCAPIDKNTTNGNVSYIVDDKEKFPTTDNLETYFFSKNTIYPNDGNLVFKGDSFKLVIDIVKDGTIVTRKVNEIEDDQNISVGEFGGVLQILRGFKESIPINYGDFLSFTNFIESEKSNCKTCMTNDLKYKSTLIIENVNSELIGDRHRNIVDTDNQLFFMYPVDKNDLNSPITYYSKFYLKSKIGNGIIKVDSEGNLISTSEKATENIENAIFYMIPKDKGYYCKDEECVEVNLEDCVYDGEKAFYINDKKEKLDVFRRNDCFKSCVCENELDPEFLESNDFNEIKSKQNKNNWYITLFVCILIILLLLILYFVF